MDSKVRKVGPDGSKHSYPINGAVIDTQKVPRKSCTMDTTAATCPTVLFHTCSNADNDNDEELLLEPFDSKGSFRGYVIEDVHTEQMDGDEESEVT